MSKKIDKTELKRLNEANCFFTGELTKYGYSYNEKEKLAITKSLGLKKDEVDFQKLEEIVSELLCSLKYQFILSGKEKNLKNSNQTKIKNDLVKSIQKFKKILFQIEKDYQQVVDEIDQTYHKIIKQQQSDKSSLVKDLAKIKNYNSYDYFDDLSSENFNADNSLNFFRNVCRDSLIRNITELEIVLHLSIKNNKKGGPDKKTERRRFIYRLKKFYEFYSKNEFGYNKDFKQFFYLVIKPIEAFREYKGLGIGKSTIDDLSSTWKDLILDVRKSC
ncbi:MAG: hypothetical protein EBS06_08320 [Proteobacteria bacterium]|nr:hypothetical protein [Pseudomonadota bacterium]